MRNELHLMVTIVYQIPDFTQEGLGHIRNFVQNTKQPARTIMLGFCKKRHRETADLREFFGSQEKNDEKRFLWLANERDNQVTVLSSRLGTFFAELGPFLSVMQGYCHPGETATHESNERFLIDFLREYRSIGDFQTPMADGCYTILLVDGVKGKVFLYRNLVGSTLTYYTLTEEGFFWGSNFAQIVRVRRKEKTLDEAMLPILFLGRYPTGNKTLVQEVFRLLPGELVVFDGESIHTDQVTTFRDLDESRKTNETESIERVDAVAAEIMRDWGSLYPNTANLLSGGIDSTFLQVHWNAGWESHSDDKPLSAVVWMDHPKTKLDLQYTLSAAEATGTHNIAVEQPLPTPVFLAQIISRNGEFPNHVQSIYFDTLAKGMREHGIDAGIIGEGADGLFGTGVQDTILAAKLWRKRFPSRLLRNLAVFACRKLGKDYTADIVETANMIDDVQHPLHPVNQAAVFTDWKTLNKCFDKAAIDMAVDYKLELLYRLNVQLDPLNLQLSLAGGYVWEAAVTASYWSQLFAENGLTLCTPFLDSRMIRAALNIDLEAHFVPGNPKQVLKNALLRHVPPDVVNRPKLGFGQPIFEWLSPGGAFRERAEAIRTFEWFSESTKRELLAQPNWCLWTLLCFDIWYDVIFQ